MPKKPPTPTECLKFLQRNFYTLAREPWDGLGSGGPCEWRVINYERNAYDLYERRVIGSGKTPREAITNAMPNSR